MVFSIIYLMRIAGYDQRQGKPYTEVLAALHKLLNPRNYLELGVDLGTSLRLANCASVGVDPCLARVRDVKGRKPALYLFQKTSDDFFASVDVKALFDGPVDFAFLDGLHLFEVLLRDFMNVERCSHAGTVIAIHDCFPVDVFMTSRSCGDERHRLSSYPKWWTGDVWKMVPVLKRYRPDLQMAILEAPPTGLVLVTNLDPSSAVLCSDYQTIVDAYVPQDLETYGYERFIEECELVPASAIDSLEELAKVFPLERRM